MIDPEFLMSPPLVVEPVSAGHGGTLSYVPIPDVDHENIYASVADTATLIDTAVPDAKVNEQSALKSVHVFATLPPAVKVMAPVTTAGPG